MYLRRGPLLALRGGRRPRGGRLPPVLAQDDGVAADPDRLVAPHVQRAVLGVPNLAPVPPPVRVPWLIQGISSVCKIDTNGSKLPR